MPAAPPAPIVATTAPARSASTPDADHPVRVLHVGHESAAGRVRPRPARSVGSPLRPGAERPAGLDRRAVVVA
ncbi:hypothetical protein [Nocardia sp. NPDC059239]|uniref:hypothetical protein n=1 Tax=unclassified Nocardia TaxID=2637762 RepID=UPI00368601B0